MIHLLGDAINNIVVMVSATIIWQTGFLRADGIASLFVGIMIISTAIPLMKNSGRLLLEAAPEEMDLSGIERDIMRVNGIEGVHEMHVFSLSESRCR
jgi:zinc transporter 1